MSLITPCEVITLSHAALTARLMTFLREIPGVNMPQLNQCNGTVVVARYTAVRIAEESTSSAPGGCIWRGAAVNG